MSRYIFITIVLILLPLFTSNIYSQSGNAKSLEIGNMWIYSHVRYLIGFPVDTSYVKEIVIGDTLLNGIHYAVIKRDNGYYSFERADTVKIYKYNTSIDSEYVLVDFSQQDSAYIEVDTIFFWNQERVEVCIYNPFPPNRNEACYNEGIGKTYHYSMPHGGNGFLMNIAAALLNGIKYGDTVLVGINKNEYIPTKYELFQNYPNPFNPKTKIKFSIPKTTNVILSIYNLTGEKITSLVDQELSLGNYEYEFDGSDIGSGVYFYQLRTKDFIDTKKFILIK